ncbi:MAG: hypothetical protein OCC49_05240 [Fibrobacterales bacterium]
MKNLTLILTLLLILTGCFLSNDPGDESPKTDVTPDTSLTSSSTSLCRIIDGDEYCPTIDISSQDINKPDEYISDVSSEGYYSSEWNISSEEYSSEWYEYEISSGWGYEESSFDYDNAYEVGESERCIYGEQFEAYSTYNYKQDKWYCPDTTGYNYKVEKQYTSGDTVHNVGFCNADDLDSYEYVRKVPVYISYTEYLALIKNTPAVTPKHFGVTLNSGTWKLVNEIDEGIHVYDNTDPQNPIYTTFITIPGNKDFVIKNNTLLANSYEVLLAIDFTTPTAVTLLKDIPEILVNSSYGRSLMVSKDLGFISGITEVRTTEVYCRNGLYTTNGFESSNAYYFENEYSGYTYDYAYSSYDMMIEPYYEENGIAEIFALGDDYLYALRPGVLITINVADETSPKYLSQNKINDWDITSIYISNEMLFLAGYEVIQLVDLTNPSNPGVGDPLRGITHCDELIVVEDFLYASSVRNKECYSRNNGLTIVNISDKSEPVIEEVYSMDGPTDIEIVDGFLYVCDGRAGFKIYTVEGAELDLVAQIDSIVVETVSVIDLVATLIGEDGIYIYDVSDAKNPVEVSFTPTP